jgi:hypothetical protein
MLPDENAKRMPPFSRRPGVFDAARACSSRIDFFGVRGSARGGWVVQAVDHLAFCDLRSR